MTFPHSPFPDETDLFPHWTIVLDYLRSYAQGWGLYDSDPQDWNSKPEVMSSENCCPTNPTRCPRNTSGDQARRELPRRILCNREFYSATWHGSTQLGQGGRWRVVSKPFPESMGSEQHTDEFDAIIDATGHLVHPSIPLFAGQEEWLGANSERRIMHSGFYRGPEAFRGKTVLVVGAGPSGLDGSLQISRTAKKVEECNFSDFDSRLIALTGLSLCHACRGSSFRLAVRAKGSRVTFHEGCCSIQRWQHSSRVNPDTFCCLA